MNTTSNLIEIEKRFSSNTTSSNQIITDEEADLVEAANKKDELFPKLFDWSVWNGVYNVTDISIDEKIALSTVQSIQIQTYRYEADSKQTLLVSKGSSSDEKRTRMHTGPTNFDVMRTIGHDLIVGNHVFDSRNLLGLNLLAISALAERVDTVSSNMKTLLSLMSMNKSKVTKIYHKINRSQRFESLSQMVAKTLSIESRLLSKKVLQLCDTVKADIKFHLLEARKIKNLNLMDDEAKKVLYANEVKESNERTRIRDNLQLDSNIKSIQEGLTSMNKISSLGLSHLR